MFHFMYLFLYKFIFVCIAFFRVFFRLCRLHRLFLIMSQHKLWEQNIQQTYPTNYYVLLAWRRSAMRFLRAKSASNVAKNTKMMRWISFWLICYGGLFYTSKVRSKQATVLYTRKYILKWIKMCIVNNRSKYTWIFFLYLSLNFLLVVCVCVCVCVIFLVSRMSVLKKAFEFVKFWISWNENYQIRSGRCMVLLLVSYSLFFLCQRKRRVFFPSVLEWFLAKGYF